MRGGRGRNKTTGVLIIESGQKASGVTPRGGRIGGLNLLSMTPALRGKKKGGEAFQGNLRSKRGETPSGERKRMFLKQVRAGITGLWCGESGGIR